MTADNSSPSPGSCVQRRPVPPDSCWGVPIAAALSSLLACLSVSSYGYLYVRFMEVYAVNHQEAIWPQSVQIIVAGCSGVGLGMIMLGLSLYILLHFKEYIATATAIKYVGWAAAAFGGPQLTAFLDARYGVQGTLLLTGAITMHILPVVMLIKHPCRTDIRCFKRETNCKEESFQSKTPYAARIDERENKSLSCGVQVSKTSTNIRAHQDVPVKRLACFKMLPFYVMVTFSIIAEYTAASFSMTIVDYSVDKGSQLQDAKQILLYNGLGQLLGRVVVPFASDKIAHSRCPITVLSMSTAAACFLVLPHISAFKSVASLAVIVGLTQGYVMCIRPVLVADYMGVARLTFCTGMTGLTGIPLHLGGPYIVGFFRDKLGSYDYFYALLAALNLLIASAEIKQQDVS
ncbi:uncharacterized protein LOC144146447 [Haemaphysalis longicornis]